MLITSKPIAYFFINSLFERYARQVAEFFEFVKKKKEVSDSLVEEDTKTSNQPSMLLPHTGNLWMPGKQPFPGSAVDFRKAMSFMPQ